MNKATFKLLFDKELGEEAKSIISYYTERNYKRVLEKTKGNDLESKLFLAKAHAALNNYDEAKTLYKDIIQEEDQTFSKLAKSELNQMNRKFFLYGYSHYFDDKFEQSKNEFEFLKSKITPQDEVAEHLSLLLMLSYKSTGELKKAVNEAEYFLKTFPKDSKHTDYVTIFQKLVKALIQQEKSNP